MATTGQSTARTMLGYITGQVGITVTIIATGTSVAIGDTRLARPQTEISKACVRSLTVRKI